MSPFQTGLTKTRDRKGFHLRVAGKSSNKLQGTDGRAGFYRLRLLCTPPTQQEGRRRCLTTTLTTQLEQSEHRSLPFIINGIKGSRLQSFVQLGERKDYETSAQNESGNGGITSIMSAKSSDFLS